MKLKKLIKDLNIEVKGSKEVDIVGISSHSQFVTPGCLFIAKKGKQFDGTQYIPAAIQSGASAILTDVFNPFLSKVVQLITSDIEKVESIIAQRYYSIDTKKFHYIGITGTNGKTTSAYLIYHFLKNFGLMGTIETIFGHQRVQSQLTTGDMVTNYKACKEMYDQGLDGVVMEVTSHALDQNRLGGICYDQAIFTNISHDHLDYHETMDKYFNAKCKLISISKEHIYNIDDPWFCKLNSGATFGIKNAAELQALNIHYSLSGTSFDLKYDQKTYHMQTSLVGEHNVYNILAATLTCLRRGSKISTLQSRLKTFKGVKGRLERIKNSRGLYIFIDFAHTPTALESVLKTLSMIKTSRVITVFGCGGDRDQEKRPLMGAIAQKYSDQIIVTSDNPRSEDPQIICSSIVQGLAANYKVIVDRAKAIEYALDIANASDIVLIAGKGHESTQIINGRRMPFSDHNVVLDVLDKQCVK